MIYLTKQGMKHLSELKEFVSHPRVSWPTLDEKISGVWRICRMRIMWKEMLKMLEKQMSGMKFSKDILDECYSFIKEMIEALLDVLLKSTKLNAKSKEFYPKK